jgi:hypothetical protein
MVNKSSIVILFFAASVVAPRCSGKNLMIGSLRDFSWPRSTAIPTSVDRTLFEADFKLADSVERAPLK